MLKSEDVLGSLIQRLSMMGFGESISEWLDGDSKQSYFEFQVRDCILNASTKQARLDTDHLSI